MATRRPWHLRWGAPGRARCLGGRANRRHPGHDLGPVRCRLHHTGAAALGATFRDRPRENASLPVSPRTPSPVWEGREDQPRSQSAEVRAELDWFGLESDDESFVMHGQSAAFVDEVLPIHTIMQRLTRGLSAAET